MLAHDNHHFQQNILRWFKQHGRKNLPWQQQATPYRVWISEIMLQQTQVNTVIPFFERFMRDFPTVAILAQAPLDHVLTLWAGLGYYARARNLYRSAQLIVEQFNGELPNNLSDLIALPGIGRSTAGAILALGHKKIATILDGNVKRVLARTHKIEGWPGQPSTEKQLWTLAEHYTPKKNNRTIAHYTQAMMDLGAMICARTQPKCTACPLQSQCLAYQQNEVSAYPHSKPKKKLPTQQRYFVIFRHQQTGKILLEKRPPTGIWGGLWALPQHALNEDIKKITKQLYGFSAVKTKTLPTFRHTFSHFHLEISPLLIDVRTLPVIQQNNEMKWHTTAQINKIGLPQPVKKLLSTLLD